MIFNTWLYAAFTLLTFVVYWFLVPKRWRAVVLLSASYLFFTYHFPFHTLLILVMTLVIYSLSLRLFKYKPLYDLGQKLAWHQHPKFVLTVIIVFATAILCYYKYLKMAISTLNSLLHVVDAEKAFQLPSMVVPLGLSFFVFEFIHYAIDVYHGKAEKTGLFQFAVFIMYFPTLVSGPIKRYTPFNEQTKKLAQGRFQLAYLYEGLSRILLGLFKKAVIADLITPFADYLLHPETSTAHQLVYGMYAYAIKIYFDFSGYSDIAIGSARLFGYQVPENFNHPYFRRNLAEFWNHWHMSLSSWIRDYIYIPLGGSRGSAAFAARNSFLAMMVSGLWHGAAWHFVFWGAYHGAGMAWLRFYGRGKQQWFGRSSSARAEISATRSRVRDHARAPWWTFHWLGTCLSTVFTFHFVAVGWIFFYCDFNIAFQDLHKIFGGILRVAGGLI